MEAGMSSDSPRPETTGLLLRLALTVVLVLPAAAGVMWLIGGREGVCHWHRMGAAAAVAFGAGVAFFPMLHLGRGGRRGALLACVAVASFAPAIVPPAAGGLRFLATVLAVTMVWKLSDLHRSPACGLRMGFAAYVAYLPNWFWFVCGRPPVSPPAARDGSRGVV